MHQRHLVSITKDIFGNREFESNIHNTAKEHPSFQTVLLAKVETGRHHYLFTITCIDERI